MNSLKPAKRKFSEPCTTSSLGSLDVQCSAETASPLGPSPGSAPYHDSSQDVDLFSAAEALTRLNSCTTGPTLSSSSTASTPHHHLSRSPSVSSPTDVTQQVHPIVLLVNAMSRLPIVTNAVKYYETSKRNYATFNYAAAFVEKAAIPVFSKIEVNLNNLHQARQEKARKKRRLAAKNPKDKTEIKKRLKFCLHILKLANDNISAKISDLQLRIAEADKQKLSENVSGGQLETPDVVQVVVKEEDLTNVSAEKFEDNELTRVSSSIPDEETNVEIVKTVKKIIHIISNFRPSSLSASGETSDVADGSRDDDVKLRSMIRSIILNLPNQIQKSKTGPLPCHDRVMEFARESLDMIGLLTNVFNDQLQKAESWVDGPELNIADKMVVSGNSEVTLVEKHVENAEGTVSEKQP